MEKATFEDLIARKIQRDEDKLKVKEIEVPSLGKTLLFKKPKDESVVEVAGAAIPAQDGDMAKLFEAYKKLIYLCCDALQNPKLHKEMDIIDPFDVVQAIFEPDEVITVGSELLDFVELEKVDEKIKN